MRSVSNPLPASGGMRCAGDKRLIVDTQVYHREAAFKWVDPRRKEQIKQVKNQFSL
jgi:hypothetical protein